MSTGADSVGKNNESGPIVWTTMSVLKWSIQHLISKNFVTPRLDSELLLSHSLGCSRVQLYTQYEKPLTEDERTRYRSLLRRRLSQEPVSYITGSREFFGRGFQVGPDVLIPRPDTEILIEQVQKIETDRKAAIRCLDLCTGSGCIAVTLACEFPNSRIIGVDISSAALKFAEQNANMNAVGDRVQFYLGDVFKAIPPNDDDLFDWIVSNPPYIPHADIAKLASTVRDFEPILALDGGLDGLSVFRALVPRAFGRLKSGGRLAVEVGQGQSALVGDIFRAAGFVDVRVAADLGGIERVVIGVRQ